MKSSQQSGECPDYAKLSEFADNPVDQEVAAHLEECPACRRQVDSYVMIQNLLKANSAPPSGLTEKILSSVQGLRLSRPPRSLVWLRYAAAIAATAVLTVILTEFSHSDAVPADARPALASAAAPAPPTSQAMENLPSASAPQIQEAPRSVATGPLQTVSTDSEPSSRNGSTRKYLPGSHVTHIWSASDIRNARNLLDESLAGHPLTWHQTDGVLSTQFSISDQTLQELVDRLYNSGWELFSPLYPQPGASDQTILTGRKITYQIKIIPRQ